MRADESIRDGKGSVGTGGKERESEGEKNEPVILIQKIPLDCYAIYCGHCYVITTELPLELDLDF